MLKYYKKPITANFIVTRNCNGNCIFCGVEHLSNKKTKDIEYEKIQKIIDKLYENEVLRINFFGGEPLIYPDIIKAIKYAKEKEFYTTLITNGIYWKDSFNELSTILDGIAVSLHGTMINHCALTLSNEKIYKKIRSTIEKINQLNIPLTINMTVTSKNYKDIIPFVNELKRNYNIKAFAFNRYISNPELPEIISNSLKLKINQINETLEDIDSLAKIYKDTKFKYAIHFPLCIVKNKELLKYVGDCGFGQNYISIDCMGTIQPCSYTNAILGNILTDDFDTIWNNSEILKDYRKLKWLPKKCKDCELFNKCHSGCKETKSDAFSYDEILDEVIKNEKI